MGFLDKLKAAQTEQAFNAFYGAHSVRKGDYRYVPTNGFKPVGKPVVGAIAEFESGAGVGGRTTLGRVAAGAIVAGPIGAVVGGMFKKDRAKVYVTTTFADGEVVILEGPAKDESQIRDFARKVNAAANRTPTE